MTTLIFDTALALPFGSPRQRAAEALRSAFSTAGEVRMVTLDPWGTEWADRMRMALSDRLLPGRRKRGEGTPDFFAWPRRMAAGRFPPPAQAEGEADPFRSWLPARRIERLAALAERLRPARIVLADPLLAPLAGPLRSAGGEMILSGAGHAAWHEEAARRMPDAGGYRWHARLAGLLHEESRRSRRWLIPPAEEIPLVFPFDDAFLSKSRSVVVLSTGIGWLDGMTLAALRAALETMAARGGPAPEIVLIGFPPDLAQMLPDALVQPHWTHLAGLIGGARALWLPWLTPDLMRVALAALALGTPVLVHPRDAALWRIEGQEGLLPVRTEMLAVVLAHLLDPAALGTEDYRRIAEEAQGVIEAQRRRAAERLGLAAIPAAAPPRPRRVPVLLGEPAVLWNPLTHLVLARMQIRGSAGIEEVRLLDAEGRELYRLVPNDQQRRQRIIALEGGLIASPTELQGGLRIALHGAEGVLTEYFVPSERFLPLEAEIAMLHRDGAILHGAFWARGGDPSSWAIGWSGFQMGLSQAEHRPMPDIGGVAVSFSVPLPLTTRSELSLWQRRATSRFASAESVHQRVLPVTPLLAAPTAPPPDPLQKLQDIHRGRRGWIVGNGPSVRLEDLAAIPADDVVFCFNRFHLSYDSHPLREDYVVSADTLMIRDFGQEMIDRSAGLALFCQPLSVMPPLKGPYVHLPPGDNPLPLFSRHPGQYVSVGGSSVFVALQMAHWMGIRDVALYGIDYSFSMTLRRDPRYPFPVSFEEGNHFIAAYREARPWCPPTWRDISSGFLNARVAFETTGGRIVNATRGGRLEIFPRRDFDELIRERAG